MGELFRTSIKMIEEQLDVSSLRTCIFLGKIGGLSQSGNPRLQIHLIPRYKAKGADSKEVIPIPPEVLEVAERLKRAESKLVREEEKIDQLKVQIEVPPKTK